MDISDATNNTGNLTTMRTKINRKCRKKLAILYIIYSNLTFEKGILLHILRFIVNIAANWRQKCKGFHFNVYYNNMKHILNITSITNLLNLSMLQYRKAELSIET